MKYIWEESDIRVGRRILSHNSTEEFIVTYSNRECLRDKGEPCGEYPDPNRKYGLVSLRDGCQLHEESKKGSLSETLNKHNYIPVCVKNQLLEEAKELFEDLI